MSTKKSVFSVRQLCAAALGTALIAVCSWISIPMPTGISITMQTFAIFLIAGLLGLKCGTISVLAYLLLGAIGLPVFSGFKGGIASLLGPTGGYLLGFLFTAVIIGWMTHKMGRKVPALLLSMVIGLAVCYLFGTIWFRLVYTGDNASAKSMLGILGLCVFPYLPFDAIKLALAVFLVRRLDGHIPLRN